MSGAADTKLGDLSMSLTAKAVQHNPDDFHNGSLLSFLWLEITGKCNLNCVHCYADSSPAGEHGILTVAEWKTIIADAHALGTRTVQFIGGEPTIHPHFLELVRYAATIGLSVEVYTNLIGITAAMWSTFEQHAVSLATSFYAHDASVHDRVTMRAGSQERTLKNIQEALRRQIPLRVGIITGFDGQDVTKTMEMLRTLGVKNVRVDSVRGVGRGIAINEPSRPVEALCGGCGTRNAAVDPHGWVYPCVFSRWLRAGNVRTESLKSIYAGSAMLQMKGELNAEFAKRKLLRGTKACNPDCNPNEPCNPDTCSPDLCNPDK